ncbi:MAG: OmpA family protein [Saprospiraceae bacterium]|nr:OmpA family protein [Saprospiraceae bacterium]
MRIFLLIPVIFLWQCTAANSQSRPDSMLLEAETMVYFDFGKDTFLSGGMDSLEGLLLLTKGRTNQYIDILAHTDSIGSLSANEDLALRRADNVRTALLGLGWPAERLRYSGAGKVLPLASNATEAGRKANRRAEVRLYKKRPMALLKGQIVDDSTNTPIQALVIVEGQGWRDSTETDTTGRYSFLLPLFAKVRVSALAAGYFLESKMTEVKPGKNEFTLPLKIAKPGEKADIDQLFFLGNQAILTKASEPILPNLFHFMTLNPKLSIEIAGHVNVPNVPPVDQSTLEFQLSVDRAKMVYDYLIKRGISKKRMRFKGYGNSEMRYPFAITNPHQALNRRVEIRIVAD